MIDPANALVLERCVVPALVLGGGATPLVSADDLAALVAQHCEPGDDAARAALPARAAHACLAQASVWPWVGDRIYEWYDELF